MSHWNRDRPATARPGDVLTAETYLGPHARPDPSTRFGEDAPQAFLVEMGAGTELRTHFHPIDQFQVFVSGSGRFGRHDVSAGVVHYTDADTPYGPLRPGADGIGFLTLRARTDSGASFMPESRAVLDDALARDGRRTRRRRNTTLPVDGANDEQARAGTWTWDLDDDGVRAGRLALTAGASASTPPIGGGGAYAVVLAGDADLASHLEACAGRSLWWLAAGTPALVLTAGPGGADVVLLQLPVPTTAARTVAVPA